MTRYSPEIESTMELSTVDTVDNSSQVENVLSAIGEVPTERQLALANEIIWAVSREILKLEFDKSRFQTDK